MKWCFPKMLGSADEPVQRSKNVAPDKGLHYTWASNRVFMPGKNVAIVFFCVPNQDEKSALKKFGGKKIFWGLRHHSSILELFYFDFSHLKYKIHFKTSQLKRNMKPLHSESDGTGYFYIYFFCKYFFKTQFHADPDHFTNTFVL